MELYTPTQRAEGGTPGAEGYDGLARMEVAFLPRYLLYTAGGRSWDTPVGVHQSFLLSFLLTIRLPSQQIDTNVPIYSIKKIYKTD